MGQGGLRILKTGRHVTSSRFPSHYCPIIIAGERHSPAEPALRASFTGFNFFFVYAWLTSLLWSQNATSCGFPVCLHKAGLLACYTCPSTQSLNISFPLFTLVALHTPRFLP